MRDTEQAVSARALQRTITERLLLSALREQDATREAVDAGERARYLAKASRDLAMSLDERAIQETIRRLALPREGAWCIVDVIDSTGTIQRLPIVHPDPAKQSLARKLEQIWAVTAQSTETGNAPASKVVSVEAAGAALMLAAHGAENLRLFREIGFGSMLVVPMIVRATVRGAITFVSAEGDPPFTSDEIALAVDLGVRAALALDNARMYREADGLRNAAEAASQSKTDFLASMSHELRTPLNAIGGFAELMELGIQGPVTEEQLRSLHRIRTNQQHLLGMITEILEFVRGSSGRTEYVTSAVSMTQALSEIADMLSATAAAKGVAIVRSFGADDVMAWADPTRVRQILLNLVMNAVKYARVGAGTITLSCRIDGDFVRADVADEGLGIPAEKLQAIFEPFVQLSAGLTKREGGVGLGLAISRDLARAMRGDLTVSSTIGVGSCFTLSLPVAVAVQEAG